MNSTLKPMPSQCVKTEKFNEFDVETDALSVCENRKKSMNPTLKPTPTQVYKQKNSMNPTLKLMPSQCL